MEKSLLIVGGSHADIPVIKAAKNLGCHVVTTGNCPEELGHIYSDEYIYADYSNPQEVIRVAKSLNVDFICPSSNDFSAISAAYVAQELKLPGADHYETSLLLHHKDRFRKLCEQCGISAPTAVSAQYSEFVSIADKLRYPLLVKPVDLSGGKGISRVSTPADLMNSLEKANGISKAPVFVVEEFITGTNHGYSTFIRDGKVVFSFMDDEHYYINPYLVSGASTSGKFSHELAMKLNIMLEKIASELNLVDGILHVQFILHEDKPYILELCRRTPGDLYVELVKYATGFDMAQGIVLTALGEDVTFPSSLELKPVTRHCVMTDRKGYIAGVEYGCFSKDIFDGMSFYNVGDFVDNPMTYKAEIVFVGYKDHEDMILRREQLTDEIKIKFMSG